MLHILFKDFSPSVSQLSPDLIPIVLLDAFCSFITVIFSPYSSLHTLPIICQDNSFSVGVEQAQPPALPHTWSKQRWPVRFLSQHLLPVWPPSTTQPCPLPFLLSLLRVGKLGKCFLTGFLLPRCHSACFSLLSGLSHATDLVFTSWMPGKV